MQLHLTNTRLHTNGVVSGLSFNCWPINLSFLNWNVLSTQSCSLIMLSFAYNGAIISMVGLFEKLHHLFYIICYLYLEIDLGIFYATVENPILLSYCMLLWSKSCFWECFWSFAFHTFLAGLSLKFCW